MTTCRLGGGPTILTVERASSIRARMKGLLGRRALGPGRAMHIIPCSSVHTCFMCFALDLIFLDRANRVVRIRRDVKPWRIVWGGRRAHSVLELEAGWLSEEAAGVGAQVVWFP
jgi:uncharacterized membrane protein (UPF0127 family)